MDRARNLSSGYVRTAPGLWRTDRAIQLAGMIAHHAVLIDERARHSIDFLTLPELLPGGTDLAVSLVVISKVIAREGAIAGVGFGQGRDVRFNPAFRGPANSASRPSHRRCRRSAWPYRDSKP